MELEIEKGVICERKKQGYGFSKVIAGAKSAGGVRAIEQRWRLLTMYAGSDRRCERIGIVWLLIKCEMVLCEFSYEMALNCLFGIFN